MHIVKSVGYSFKWIRFIRDLYTQSTSVLNGPHGNTSQFKKKKRSNSSFNYGQQKNIQIAFIALPLPK